MEAEERPSKVRKLDHHEVADVPGSAHSGSNAVVMDPKDSPENSALMLESTAPDANDIDLPAAGSAAPQINNNESEQKPMSKSQMKKLKRRQEWEDGREDRKIRRKEKTQDKKARKRAAREEEEEQRRAEGIVSASIQKPKSRQHTLLPITFLIDCGFDDLMAEKEMVSLGSQLTRSYSDNHQAPFQGHLVVSSWEGKLKERFDTVLHKHYKNWKGVKFTSDDFVKAAEHAKGSMSSNQGGKLAGAFQKYSAVEPMSQPRLPEVEESVLSSAQNNHTSSIPNANGSDNSPQLPKSAQNNPQTIILSSPSPNISESVPEGEVIYLTSDSPHTLTHLSPYSTYIIGGLVDKNRHKGICYKRACDRGIKTAKLPIGEFMEMQSRFVLATNHVVEIMVRWLECGDWGESFLRVIPKRKGGRLKNSNDKDGESADGLVKMEGDPALEEDAGEQEENGDESGSEEPEIRVEDEQTKV